MKILKYYTSVLFIFALVFGIALTACKGPTGEEGPRGPKGDQGEIGPAGEYGSMMHADKGAPAGDLGKVSDFYLNTSAAEMYGPKAENGWGVPISLQGPPGEDGQDGVDGKNGEDGKDGQDGADGQDGQDGEDGSQIYSGTSVPAASLGQEGGLLPE